MNSRALFVPRNQGEAVRRRLLELGALRTDLRIEQVGERIALPIVDSAAVDRGLGDFGEREFAPVAAPPAKDYRERLSGDAASRAALPRSFDVIGDVVIVRVPDEVTDRREEIGRALLGFVPGARVVGRDLGVRGPDRRRSLERIAGEGGWRTRHRENGIELEVDLERAYFSPRLGREHARVAADIARGDRVYDLCCGVGPFSSLIARDARAARVTAVDANPAALALLRATLERLEPACPVEVVARDVGEFSAAAPPVERVIFNLPLEGIKYLPSVARTVVRGGRLYYYEVTPRTERDARAEGIARSLGGSGAWAPVATRAVHPYSPRSDLVAFVLEHREDGGAADELHH